MTEYHYALRDRNKLHWIGYICWKRRRNKLGRILNLDISFEEDGITIGGVPARKLK